MRWACALMITTLAACTSSPPLPPLPAAVGIGDSESPEVIRIGVLTPMTGELATFGELARNGVRLSLDEWNEAGGVNGHTVVWVLEDTACDAVVTRQAAERLIAEGVDLLVGGVCSASAIVTANVAQERGALFVALAATHPLVTVDGYGVTRPTVFRAAYEYGYQGAAAARFLLQQPESSQSVVVFDPGNAYERALAEAFVQGMVAGGRKVVQVVVGSPDEIDWPSVWTELEPGQPVALYVPGSVQAAAVIAGQETFVYVVGSESWRGAEAELMGLSGAFFTDHFDIGVTTVQAQSWSRRYEAAFSQEPDTLSSLGYEAMDLLAHAIEGAGRSTPEAVAHQLETTSVDGVLGAWRFDESHNPGKHVVILRVTDGRARYFSVMGP